MVNDTQQNEPSEIHDQETVKSNKVHIDYLFQDRTNVE